MMIIPFFTGGGDNVSNKQLLSFYIVINLLLVIFFGILFYLFMKGDYVGNFWEWSWDDKYSWRKYQEGMNFPAGMFWITVFFLNGIALIIWLCGIVEKYLLTPKNKNDESEQLYELYKPQSK